MDTNQGLTDMVITPRRENGLGDQDNVSTEISANLKHVSSSLNCGGSRISQRRGCQLKRWGRQPIILPTSPQKMHKNEKIWTWRLPFKFANVMSTNMIPFEYSFMA